MTSSLNLHGVLFISLMLATSLVFAQSAEVDIGYDSVESARSDLMARQDVRLSTADGWLTVEDPVGMTLWTFAPESDPAHPAVIKRSVVEDGDSIVIRMDIRCEGDIDACDGLEEHFMSLNESVRDQVPPAEPESDDAPGSNEQ